MNRRAIKASGLGAVMALVCVAELSAQHQHSSDSLERFPDTTQIEIMPGHGWFRLDPSPSLVTTATIIDKFTWAGVSLFDPHSRYKPVPVYGYPMSSFALLDEETRNQLLISILPSVANNTVQIARLTPSEEGQYQGRAILYSGGGDDSRSDALLEAWRAVEGHLGEGDLIGFSRPIRAEAFGDENVLQSYEELSTGQGLWAAVR